MIRVGKIVYLLIICSSLLSGLELRITTMDDIPLKQAAIGEPFLIHVRDTESAGSIQQPHIKGLDQLVQQGTTFAMHTINNIATVVYKYKVRADTAGTYTIGPATVNHAGVSHTSNGIELTVGKQSIHDKKYHKKPTIFATLAVDKDQVVIGEKVVCTLTVYSSEQLQTRIQSIETPKELGECGTLVHDPENIEQGTQLINGKSYVYGRWQWEIYPKQLGSYILPAFGIDYTALTSSNTFFSFMDWWENKRTYSNAVTLHIDPLPPYNGTVNGIGTFIEYTATLDKHVAQAGTALVLSLTLVGEGNWATIQEPSLTGIDEAVRAYYSSSTIQECDEKGMQRKTFEYVLQGVKAGDSVIEPQIFTYFDTSSQMYTQLTTAPLYATITPAPDPITFDEPVQKKPIEDDIHPLKTVGRTASFPHKLPLWLFILLLLLPLVMLCVYLMRNVYHWCIRRSIPLYAQKQAGKQAHQRIDNARISRNYAELHDIFIRYFAAVTGTRTQVTSECIQELLSVCTQEQRAQWNLFFKSLITLRFRKNEKETDAIFTHAYSWIACFEEQRIGRTSVRWTSFFPFSYGN